MKRTKKNQTSNRYFDTLGFLNNLLIAIFIFLLPTQLGKHFFFSFSYLSGVRVDYLSPTLYLIDIFVTVLVLLNLDTVVKFFSKKIFFFLGLAVILNIILAKSPVLALYGAARFFELLVVISLGKELFRKAGERLVLAAILTSSLVELGLAVAQFVFKHSIQGPFYFLGERLFSLGTPGIAKIVYDGVEFLRPYGTFSHPNSMAGFYLVIYFLVLVYKPFENYRMLKYLALFLSSCLIFITFSKTAIAAFLFLNVAYVIVNAKTLCRICAVSRIVVLVVLSMLFFLPTGDPMTIVKRAELAGNSLQIIKANFLTGTGLDNYLLAQSHYTSKYPYFINQPVHNIILLFISETGLIGLAISYGLFIFVKKNARRNYWFPLAAVLITGMLDHYWLTLIQNLILMGVAVSFIGFRDHVLPGGSRSQSASVARRNR